MIDEQPYSPVSQQARNSDNQCGGLNGSGETITYNILVNNTDRYLIGAAATTKGVTNTALSIPAGSSYIEQHKAARHHPRHC